MPAGGQPDEYWYRFRARRVGSPFRLWKDFGPDNRFQWTVTSHEGAFEIEAAIRNKVTGEVALAKARYVFEPRTAGAQPTLSPTTHPLVLLYSAPPCPSGSRMKVRFQAPDGFTQETPYKPCADGLTMNFYLAGLLPETQYFVYHRIDTGDSFEDGPVLSDFSAGIPDLPQTTVLEPAPPLAPNPILLQENVFAVPVATDLSGRILWYYPGPVLSFPTRPSGRGTFFGIIQDPSGDPWKQVVREFDLAGVTLLETNAGRINEQLSTLGFRRINSFHHEAFRLPDGDLVVLGGVERILNDVQGAGAVDVLGDMLLVLDRNLNVVWVWDAFDHIDPHRRATLDDRCQPNACPPLMLAQTANDWTHANAVQFTADGNFLVSLRDLDWIVKIAYDNGEGNGDVIWRLGKDGDFQLAADPSVWFSHQHDPQFDPSDGRRLMILDNGNVRHDADPNATSRGQVFALDEAALTASVVLNADLGRYSLALGSTERLPDGNYWFDAGFLPDASGVAEEVDAAGTRTFALQTQAPVYRSYRLPDLYRAGKESQ